MPNFGAEETAAISSYQLRGEYELEECCLFSFTNIIRNASFVMDGVRYDVERNRGVHSIHSGARNFGKHEWSLGE